ncbi:hypothetical protein PCE1_000115 [Barthelona sp. PCE]
MSDIELQKLTALEGQVLITLWREFRAQFKSKEPLFLDFLIMSVISKFSEQENAIPQDYMELYHESRDHNPEVEQFFLEFCNTFLQRFFDNVRAILTEENELVEAPEAVKSLVEHDRFLDRKYQQILANFSNNVDEIYEKSHSLTEIHRDYIEKSVLGYSDFLLSYSEYISKKSHNSLYALQMLRLRYLKDTYSSNAVMTLDNLNIYLDEQLKYEEDKNKYLLKKKDEFLSQSDEFQEAFQDIESLKRRISQFELFTQS